jgi:hypothetical protein
VIVLILCGPRQRRETIDVEFDFSRQFDDGCGTVAVFEQRILEGVPAVDEQAAKEAVLLLDDPLAAAVSADKNNRRRRLT